MKAGEFVKKFGWDEAKNILNARRTWIDKKSGRELTDNYFVMQTRTYEYAIGTLYKGNFTDYDENSYRCGEVNLLMLERLIESHKLIEKDFESVEIAEYEHMISGCYSEPYWIRIKQAIADVESCK